MSKAEGIRIFLRIRPPATSKQSYLMSSGHDAGTQNNNNSGSSFSYNVTHNFDGSTIRFHLGRRDNDEVVNNTTDDYQFGFRRVFEPSATQQDVFSTVAKDCVLSVLDGYNSTVFAYGQTGSGKTYSITGGTESYEDRGIIPRALALVYEEIAKRSGDINWTVSISYLQIYNEKGQDLLNHGRDAKTIDDLPAVTVHEGEDEIVLRGLEQHFAPTITDALNLLFLGDTNRLYCETPMNKTSSRSHCVFTISLEARTIGSSVVRRSKLNLVDLAGSERVSKTGVNGTLLKEAKYINLSLHYLVHVIVALSEQAKGKRDHVPYRNSFMTMVLRDSLGGNCRTSMLATVHAAASVSQETLSTCQFAQRVALIKQNAKVNEETDPLMLVKKLRTEVAQLKDRLAFYEKGGADGDGAGGAADRALSEDEMALCRGLVDKFLQNTDPDARLEGFEGDLARIYYCFTVLKQAVQRGGVSVAGVGSGGAPTRAGAVMPSSADLEQARTQLQDYREQVDALQVSLQHKENEMNMLFDMLHKSQGPRFNAETQVDPAEAARLAEAEAAGVAGGASSAQALIHQLRQRAASQGDAAAATSEGSMQPSASPASPSASSPAQSRQAEEAALAAAQLQAHVHKLAEAGALNAAQTAAAQEFIDAKRGTARLLESYDLSALTDATLLNDRTAAFESFKRSYRHYAKVEATKGTLKDKYEACKETARRLNASVDSIKTLKVHIQRLRAERAVDGHEEADPAETQLLAQLSSAKEAYNTLASTLRGQKEEIDAMHAFMKRSQEQLTRDFEEWFGIRQQQLVQATQTAAAKGVASHEGTPGATDVQASTASASPAAMTSMAVFRGGSASSAPLLPTPPSRSSAEADIARAAVVHASRQGVSDLGVVDRHPSSAPSAASSAAPFGSTASASQAQSSPRLGGLPLHTSLSPSGPRALPAVNTLMSSPRPAHGDGNGVGGALTVSEAWRTSPRPAHTHHLQPLSPPHVSGGASSEVPPQLSTMRTGAGMSAPLSAYATAPSGALPPSASTASGINPYAPQHRSTGNSAADEKLAALYKAREQMRQQFMTQ